MTPRTNYQREVISLSRELPPLSIKKANWGYEHCLYHIGIVMKKGIVCLDCGHTFKVSESPLAYALDGCKCPNCKRKLKIDYTNQRAFKDSEYYRVVETFRGHQVFRFFLLKSKLKYNASPEYECKRVAEIWISKKGEMAVYSIRRYVTLNGYETWLWDKGMEIHANDNESYHIKAYRTYPAAKYIPEIKRNGFKGDFYNLNPYLFYSLILSNNVAETLLKTNNIEWFKYLYHNKRQVTKCWPAIKIAFRHKHEITDRTLWLDYIELLLYFKKDIRNPKVIFPENMNKEHDRLVRKKRKIQEQMSVEKKKKQALTEEEKYKKQKGKYFDLEFTDGSIIIRVLKSVQEVIQEGDEMHHCVFTNNYHRKKDSLLLSATMDGKRLATIQFSLSQFKVIQCRGKCNSIPEYHNEINQLIENNVDQIIKASTSDPKKKLDKKTSSRLKKKHSFQKMTA